MHRYCLILLVTAIFGVLGLVAAFGSVRAADLPPGPAYNRAEDHLAQPTILSTPLISGVYTLATSAAFPDVMAVGTFSQTYEGGWAGEYRNIYDALWTNDDGKTWYPFLTSPDSLRGQILSHMAIVPRNMDPERPIRFLLGDSRTIYRTGDFGRSWAVSIQARSYEQTGSEYYCYLLNLRPGAMFQTLYVEQRCYYPSSPYAANAVTLSEFKPYTFFASHDGGQTWTELPEHRLLGLTPSRAIPNRLYASDGTGFLNYRSDDDGWTWRPNTSVRFDLFTPDAEDVNRQYGVSRQDPASPRPQWQIRSSDDGRTWEAWASSPCQVETTPDSLIATGRHQLWVRCDGSRTWHYSGNGGDTWQAMGATTAEFLVPDLGNPGHVLMVDDNSLWRSVDGGKWTLVNVGFSRPPTHIYLPEIRR